MPHVTPVTYAMNGEDVIIVIDYGTKKLANLRANPQAAMTVDSYRPVGGVMIQGRCEILEKGKEYRRLLKILFDKVESYRKNPWGEGESPILKITPSKVASWGR